MARELLDAEGIRLNAVVSVCVGEGGRGGVDYSDEIRLDAVVGGGGGGGAQLGRARKAFGWVL